MECYEQFHIHKFDNLGEMDQFLKKHKLPQLTQYEINYLNSPISSKDIEFIILKLPKSKCSGPAYLIRD